MKPYGYNRRLLHSDGHAMRLSEGHQERIPGHKYTVPETYTS